MSLGVFELRLRGEAEAGQLAAGSVAALPLRVAEAADEAPLFAASDSLASPVVDTVVPAVPEPTAVVPDPEPRADAEPDLRTEVEELRREVTELRERLERLESVVL